VGKKGEYSEELIVAVDYLMKRGITRCGEIAKRLNVSPFTVRNIKRILRKRKARMKLKTEKKEKPKDFLDEILGGE